MNGEMQQIPPQIPQLMSLLLLLVSRIWVSPIRAELCLDRLSLHPNSGKAKKEKENAITKI